MASAQNEQPQAERELVCTARISFGFVVFLVIVAIAGLAYLAAR